MCVTIVPLAGPDFFTEQFGIRPLYRVGNMTLIEHVLGNRPWIASVREPESQLIFVLREQSEYTDEMLAFIARRFPSADSVVLGNMSAGAPLSALAGLALAKDLEMPVVIDLADIAFDISLNPTRYFQQNGNVDAVVPYFPSADPKYSYLKLDGPRVLEAREKQVISSNASAGVYVFRNASTYLRAVTYCMQNPGICRVGSAFYVCPSINGLVQGEREVHSIPVHNVDPVGALFHIPLVERPS